MKHLLAVLFVSICVAGCAASPARVPLITLPEEAHANPDQYLLITVKNQAAPLPTRAGSTQRGYAGVAAYGVSSAAQSLARDVAADYGLTRVADWPIAALRVYCLVYRVPPGERRDDVLARLATDPRVDIAQPLHAFSTSTTAYNDRYVGLQRGFVEMSIPAAHQWSRGEGVVVALIDSGVDTRHPDLAGRVRASRDFVVSGASQADRDRDRHGTEIAGVIAAVADNGEGIVGVAPDVRLLALRACWHDRAEDAAAACNTFTLAQALAAAIDARADVINLSLVGPDDPLLGALTARATALGSIVVGAVPASGRMDGFPAGAPGVIPVAMAETAAASPTALRAPGREVLTLQPGGGYEFATGSSLATANVSGIVALLRSRHGGMTAVEARALLDRSTRPVDATGAGIRSIDACVALALLLTRGDCPPAVAGGVPALSARDTVERR